MKKATLFLLSLILILVACGSSETEAEPEMETAVTSTRLSDDYDNALPVQSQLAVGALQLEGTERAVDETLAAELLPLWRAAQSLANSDTTAAAEVTAVVNQIQDTMTSDQIAAIAAMQLTRDSLTALIEDGTLAFSRGGFGGRSGENADSDGFAPPPGGGIPGSGRPGGGIPGGGPGQGNLSEDDIATRRAARESGDFGGFQERALTNAVILLLETKTGEVTERVDPFAAMWAVLNEATGLTTEEIQAQMDEGAVLAELIEANGGDVTAVHAQLVESLVDSPIAQRQDLEQYVTNLLNGTQE
ncbi:MAG: hypothetical protein GY803_30270 [Chloroflexi bacterium]|nr:hypothetical protein [Chloroflexota bacterium]